MGARITRLDVVRFGGSDTLGASIEAIQNRVHSTTWKITEDMLAASVRDLQEWALREYEPDYRAKGLQEEALFVLDAARFEGWALYVRTPGGPLHVSAHVRSKIQPRWGRTAEKAPLTPRRPRLTQAPRRGGPTAAVAGHGLAMLTQ